MCAGVGIGIHSVSPLVGFPCRCGFRCAFRGGALWRCMARNFLPCVLRLLRRYAWRYALWRYAWRGISHTFFSAAGGVVLACVCYSGMTCNILVRLLFFVDHLRVLRRHRTFYASRLALLGRILVVYLHRGAVGYILVLSLSTSYGVVLVPLVCSVARHITYFFFGGQWCRCCLCVVCFGARTSPKRLGHALC